MDNETTITRLRTLKYAVLGAQRLIEDWNKEIEQLEERDAGAHNLRVVPLAKPKAAPGEKRVKRKAVWTPAMKKAAARRMRKRWKTLGKAGFNLGVAS